MHARTHADTRTRTRGLRQRHFKHARMRANTHHAHTQACTESKILECCKADDFLMNGFIGHGED